MMFSTAIALLLLTVSLLMDSSEAQIEQIEFIPLDFTSPAIPIADVPPPPPLLDSSVPELIPLSVQPSAIFSVGGDPHFKTWSGSNYDYMGGCDLVLLQAPSFDVENGKTLDIAIRTKVRHDYSYIESAAIKIGGEILEVSSFGDYALNGVTNAEMPNNLSGYTVTHTQLNKKKHDFVLELGNGEKISVRTFKDWVSVNIQNPSASRYQDSVGMMGEFGTGKLLGRDGVTVIEHPNALAAEWQVRDNEDMLFQMARAPQYPAKCDLPSTTQKAARRLGEKSISEEAAKAACVSEIGRAHV